MGVAERESLMNESVAESADDPGSPRYAFRVGPDGHEWFAARLTQFVEGEPEFHGYPCSHVPVSVLRRFREAGRISQAEYRRFVKEYS